MLIFTKSQEIVDFSVSVGCYKNLSQGERKPREGRSATPPPRDHREEEKAIAEMMTASGK